MKSDIDIVVQSSQKLEKLLAERFNGKGKGLVSMLKSIEKDKISKSLDFLIREIAHARNRVVHGRGKLGDKTHFLKMVEAAKADLNQIDVVHKLPVVKPSRRGVKRHQHVNNSDEALKENASPESMELPDGFDPYVVTLDRIGTFGSVRYDK